MTDTDPPNFPKYLDLTRKSSHVKFPERIVMIDEEEREWQCIECGHVVESNSRPRICPHCNTANGDLEGFLNVMVRRDACGWYD
jgi:rubrerythrin